jgi:two-component system, cell cycle sensor histidine kinase and response regulator CckA
MRNTPNSSKLRKPGFHGTWTPLRIVALYILLGVLWILFSDRILIALVSDARLVNQIQTYKGWLYVLVTALLLYALITRMIRKQRHSERRFKRVVENIPDRVLIFDTELKIRYLNPAARDIIARPASEIIGKPPQEVWPAEVCRIWLPSLHQSMTTRAIVSAESNVPQADGRVRNHMVTFVPIFDKNEQVIELLGICHDLTERKEAEKRQRNLSKQLTQAQKMESVGRLAGGVAHDFNNMLSVIIGYVELAMIKAGPSPDLQEDLSEILKAAKRASAITQQLLAFARKQTISPKSIDLNEAIERTLKMLRRLIRENIELAWLPGSGLWLVRMDPAQVDQILANLCVNARDAITDIGRIVIETSNTAFDDAYCTDNPGFIPGDFVQLAVSDNGSGIDNEILDMVFEPFFTTKRQGQGTGLGLATVYGIVKQNGGFIKLYSEPQKGTTIRIYLPRNGGQAVDSKSGAEETIPLGHGERVLLVEDNTTILGLARKMLEGLGYNPLSAGTPAEAIQLADTYNGEIHLLITDVIMPEMNGRDLAELLQAKRPQLKCIYMSGYTSDVIAHQGVLEDGMQFLQKPFSRRDLAVKINRVLENANGKQAFRP